MVLVMSRCCHKDAPEDKRKANSHNGDYDARASHQCAVAWVFAEHRAVGIQDANTRIKLSTKECCKRDDAYCRVAEEHTADTHPMIIS